MRLLLFILLLSDICKSAEVGLRQLLFSAASIDSKYYIGLELQGGAFIDDNKNLSVSKPQIFLVIRNNDNNERFDLPVGQVEARGIIREIGLADVVVIRKVDEDKSEIEAGENKISVNNSIISNLQKSLRRNIGLPEKLSKSWIDFVGIWESSLADIKN